MKRTIRPFLFETNSSSTHSIIILSKKKMDEWRKPGMRLNEDTWEVMTDEEVEAEILSDPFSIPFDSYKKESELSEEERKDYWFQFNGYFTYDEWNYDTYLEFDSADYVTENGEEFTVLCKYGYEY